MGKSIRFDYPYDCENILSKLFVCVTGCLFTIELLRSYTPILFILRDVGKIAADRITILTIIIIRQL